jgi:hypothetical protein
MAENLGNVLPYESETVGLTLDRYGTFGQIVLDSFEQT